MTVWEYDVLQGFSLGGEATLEMLNDELDRLGKEGWELVTTIPCKINGEPGEPFIVFKRPMAIESKS